MLTSDDYYIHSSTFKAWLSSSKSLYLDEISSSEARRYFDRFVRKWNSGRLDESYYNGTVKSVAGGSSTRHKWGFTTSQADREKVALIRDHVDTLTNGQSRGAREAREAEKRTKSSRRGSEREDGDAQMETAKRDSGWTTRAASSQSAAERRMQREHEADMSRIAASQARKRALEDAADQAEFFGGGKSTGRERILERKRLLNADKRSFANRNDDSLELDDRQIYDDDDDKGDGARHVGSTRKEAGRERGGVSRREQARQDRLEERREELQGRVDDMKRKESQTMDMLKALAAERFGGGGGRG